MANRIVVVLLLLLSIGLGAAAWIYYQSTRTLEGQVKGLEEQVKGFEERVKQLEVQLAESRTQAASLQSEVHSTEQQLAAAATQLRRLPLEVKFRAAFTGDGLVAVISPTSNQRVPIKATVTRPATGAVKAFDLVLPSLGQPPGRIEIGHLEGWAFMPGDRLSIHNADFDDLTVAASRP